MIVALILLYNILLPGWTQIDYNSGIIIINMLIMAISATPKCLVFMTSGFIWLNYKLKLSLIQCFVKYRMGDT